MDNSEIHHERKWTVGARGHREDDGELVTHETISVSQDEEFWGMDGGDSYTTVWLYLIPLNCAFKNG